MRCTAIKRNGERCTNEAVIGDLCTMHFRMSTPAEEGVEV